MNILVNFIPVSQGGGMQNALSFLECLARYQCEDVNFKVICRKNSDIEKTCNKYDLNVSAVRNDLLGRVYYEFFGGLYEAKKFKADAIFSLFGGAPIVSFPFYKISGFAYSNIIHKEVDFWGFLQGRKKLKKFLIDQLRLFLARQADEIIVETQHLAEKAGRGVFRDKKIHVVNMAPGALIIDRLKGRKRYKKTQKNYEFIDILYLSGPHQNKRIHLLPVVFKYLKNQCGVARFRLVTTMPENSDYFSYVRDSFNEIGAEDCLMNIGPISPDKVGELLICVDALINVALLESFSNNWVEAWAAKLPLITTDADWARASCGKAAIYIDPESPKESADAIFELFSCPEKMSMLTAEGDIQLTTLPTPEEKFNKYMEILKSGNF
jgi:glycosyltransferase involved in cell wall biosynthesis